jgi:MFS family permease
MDDILEKAEEYRQLVATRALAHEMSAEAHRSRGALLGVMATGLSAVVASSVFVVLARQIGLDGKSTGIALQSGGWAWLVYFVFGLLLIAFAGVNEHTDLPEEPGTGRAAPGLFG